MKLNVGSSVAKGKYRNSNWINLDLFKFQDVNLRGDLLRLPFKDSSIDEIHCVHVLEHLKRDKFPVALKEMFRVIKPSCWVYVEVPNFEEIAKLLVLGYAEKNYELIHRMRTSIYGKTERPGMEHHYGFDTIELAIRMRDAGFRRVKEADELISNHYLQEPVIIMKGTK